MSKNPITLRLPEHIGLDEIEKRAQERGITRSAFLVNAIELVMDMDAEVLARMENLAAEFKIRVGLVITNKFIKMLAREDARSEVWSGPMLLDEFMFTDKGAITGKALYDELKRRYIKEEQERLIAVLKERKRRAPSVFLGDYEEALLKNYRPDLGWLTRAEYEQRMTEAEEEDEEPEA